MEKLYLRDWPKNCELRSDYLYTDDYSGRTICRAYFSRELTTEEIDYIRDHYECIEVTEEYIDTFEPEYAWYTTAQLFTPCETNYRKRKNDARLDRKGNTKLGESIATFSKLYSDEEIETPLGVIKGSCKTEFCTGCKPSCYVPKSYRYNSVRQGHGRNTLAIRSSLEVSYEELRNQLSRARKPFTIVRVHQSGELEDTREFLMWCQLAKDFPTVTFYIYTKAFPYVIPALLAGKVPDNFKINLSVWHEYGMKEYELVKHLPNVKAFICDDRNREPGNDCMEYETMCKAYDIKGKMNHDITCEKCRKCFNETTKTIGCYEH